MFNIIPTPNSWDGSTIVLLLVCWSFDWSIWLIVVLLIHWFDWLIDWLTVIDWLIDWLCWLFSLIMLCLHNIISDNDTHYHINQSINRCHSLTHIIIINDHQFINQSINSSHQRIIHHTNNVTKSIIKHRSNSLNDLTWVLDLSCCSLVFVVGCCVVVACLFFLNKQQQQTNNNIKQTNKSQCMLHQITSFLNPTPS
jgi:hypothetical protein